MSLRDFTRPPGRAALAETGMPTWRDDDGVCLNLRRDAGIWEVATGLVFEYTIDSHIALALLREHLHAWLLRKGIHVWPSFLNSGWVHSAYGEGRTSRAFNSQDAALIAAVLAWKWRKAA